MPCVSVCGKGMGYGNANCDGVWSMENMCALMIDAELVWMVGRLCARLFATCILFCI